MFNVKSARKFTAIIANLSLLLNSFIPYLMVAQPIFAQEAIPTEVVENTPTPAPSTIVETPTSAPTIEPTIAPTIEPTAAPTAEPTVNPTVEFTPTATPTNTEVGTNTPSPELTPTVEVVPTSTVAPVTEKICLTDQQIKDSLSGDWNINSLTNTSETKSKVELGVRYTFPQENKVSVMFKCLPKDESLRTNLKIQQMKTSDLKLPSDIGQVDEFAYDITTGMTDGTFEYDVTLPKTENSNAKVSYMENVGDQLQTIDNNKLSQESGVVKAVSIDHFTIYVVSTYDSSSLTTSKTSYLQGETVYAKGTSSDTQTMRILFNDDNGNTVKTCSEVTGTIASCDYSLPSGASAGTWRVELQRKKSNSWSNADTTNFEVTVPSISIGANPALTKACGLDISLVLDVSGSIDGTELSQMKTAMTGLVTALAGTPTEFSVTKFDTTATNVLGFSSNTSSVNSAINGVSGGGFTNWQDALIKGNSVFPNRTNPNLVIFASDGQPNTIGNGPANNASPEGSTAAMNPAITQANLIKSQGTRILGIGIGLDASGTANMKLISGPLADTPSFVTSDLITTNFSTLASQIATFASDTCGGKISFNKYVDGTQKSDGQTWTFQVDGTTNIPTDSSGKAVTETLSVGSHSISEISIPAGYSFDHATCTNGTPGNINVTANSVVVCDIYNTTNKGSITLVKNTVGGNGTFNFVTSVGLVPSNPSITTSGNTGSTLFSNLMPGTYSISETVPSGWDLSTAVCSDGSQVNSISLQAGENVTCKFTNTLKTGTLVINKTSVGGDGTFNFNGTGLDNISLTTVSGTATKNVTDLIAGGTYSLFEDIPSGWTQTARYCDKGGPGGITIEAGKTTTCNFQNTKKAHIIVNKVTVPSGDSQSFSFTTTGNNYNAFSLTDTQTPNDQEVDAGSYTVSETPAEGWYSDGGRCDKDETPASLDVGAGETVTCTFTNTRKRDITACKFNDINGNGQRDLSSDSLLSGWEMNLSPGNIKQTTVDGCTTFSNLLPGDYSVTETQKTNWVDTSGLTKNISLTSVQNETVNFGNYSCTNISGTKWEDVNGNGLKDQAEPVISGITINLTGADTQTTTTNSDGNYSFKVCKSGDVSIKEVNPNTELWYRTYPSKDSHDITLQSGGNYTDNNFGNAQYSSISGVKYRDNDGDGTLDADDLTSTLGGWVIDLYNAADNSVIKSYTTISDGVYSFNKLLAGSSYYVLERLTSGWTQTVGPKTKEVININSGDSKTVNFANFENMSVTACKLEDRDGNLSTKDDQRPVSGWTVKLGENSQQTDTSGCYTWINLAPGSYGVSEVVQTGWTALTPTSHSFGYLKYGQNYTYSFINFKKAKIIVHKNVLGTNGTADVLDNQNFVSYLDGLNSKTISEDTDAVYENLLPGEYTVSEGALPSGYSLVSVSNSGKVNVQSGETHEVTITNKQDSAHLTVIKNVIINNDGKSMASDFTMNVTGTNLSDDSFPGNSSGTTITLDAGDYSVDESTASGYTKTLSSDCSGTINFGESKTCTITNNDQPGTLIVKKVLVNKYNGPKYISDFEFSVNKGSPQNFEIDGQNDLTVNAGTYTVVETTTAGYDTEYDNCSGIVINNGETKICTITNSDLPATLIVKKIVVNDNGGQKEAEDFKFRVDDDEYQSFNSEGQNEIVLSAGTYSVEEKTDSGYSTDSDDCDEIVIANGETKTCTITNNDIAPKLTIVKTVVNDNGGGKEVADFNLFINKTQVVSGVGITVQANSLHTVSEGNLPGYSASSWGGDCNAEGNVILLPGQEKTCTITNDDIYGKVIVTKFNDINGDGEMDEGEPSLSDWKIELTENGTQDTDESGVATFNQVIPGEYGLSEVQQKGWTQTNIYCFNEEPTFTPTPTPTTTVTETPSPTNTPTVTITPTATPTPTLGGICHWNNDKDEWNALSVNIDNLGHSGHVKDYVYAGPRSENGHPDNELGEEWCEENYRPLSIINKLIKPIYAVTSDDEGFLVNVNPSQVVRCYVGNQQVNSKLTISKFNNLWPNNASVGSDVQYTLTLNVTENNINDVSVIDLPPSGFKYKLGSYKVFVNGIERFISEPEYHSPGQWFLGDLNENDVVTLSYLATIESSVDPGLYKDAAYAFGFQNDGEKLLASAVNSGKSDPGVLATNFVGTKIGLEPSVSTQGTNIVKEETIGQVLGASTQELPGTGANTLWMLIAALLATSGYGSISYGLKSKKKK